MRLRFSICLCVLTTAAYGGPFGLDQGMPLSQLGRARQIRPGTYHLANVPKPHSTFKGYVVMVAPKTGLCLIRAISDEIVTSKDGFHLRNTFDQTKVRLDQIYGTARVMDRLSPGSLWDRPEHWMMGLVNNDRTLGALWDKTSKATLPSEIRAVTLVAEAKTIGRGHILLEYSFANLAQCEEEIAKQEDGALGP